MNIEELAFKDRKNLAQLTELDLLDIIEFLQFDRKQWINQFSKTHNESIDIQKENKQLKDNWDELKKYLHNVDVVIDNSENYDGHFINYDELIDKIQELEQGSDSNVKD